MENRDDGKSGKHCSRRQRREERSSPYRKKPTTSTISPPRSFFKPSEDLKKSIQNQTDVALEITKHLILNLGKDKNVVYSPLSIHVVLSMIVAGTEQGHIQEQLLRFLKFNSVEELNDIASNFIPVFADGSSSGGPCLSFANGVWVEKTLGVKHGFKHVMDSVYKADLLQVDFKKRAEEARCQVNSWAEKETKGLIKEILPQGAVDRKTRIILGNALYFKGNWVEKFHASKTLNDKFHLISNNMSSVEAPFMTSRKSQLIKAFDDFKVLKLPYKQGGDYKRVKRRFAMYVFLPNTNTVHELQSLTERVCSSSEFIDHHRPYYLVPVRKFLIPKFKITCGFEALQILETLGFSPRGLTEMVDEQVYLNKIFHKSFIEVNEKGTEAAAVTAATGGFGARARPPPPPPMDFVADHPFLYMIREEMTGAVMFIGHVLNPIAEEAVNLN